MTREGKCKDGWRLPMRSIFRVSPHQPSVLLANVSSVLVRLQNLTAAGAVCFLYVCLLILNWCQCSVHKHLLKSCCFVKLPPHHTEHTPRPSTSHWAYYLLSFQWLVLFISVFTVLVGGAGSPPHTSRRLWWGQEGEFQLFINSSGESKHCFFLTVASSLTTLYLCPTYI